MIRTLPAAAALLFCGLSSSLAGEVRVSAPEFGTARGGELAIAEWKGLPAGVDELELLLSVEGRDLPLRLTPRLIPQAGLVLWRVPNILSRRARIRVRFGLDGEEVESASSAEFEILPSRSEPPAAFVFRDGEWWSESPSAAAFPGTFESAPDRRRVQESREVPPCSGSSRVVSYPAREESSARESHATPDPPASRPASRECKPIESPRRL